MNYIDNILFAIILCIGIGYFATNVKKLVRNIKLGNDVNRKDNPSARWKNMAMIALGQSKMIKRPIAGFLHVIVYVGFIIINLEVLEIIIDGLFGTHRIFSFLGGLYGFLISSFEILALLVLVAVIIFWARRNVIKLKRFWNPEMKGWPKNDGNIILYFEIVLMTLFLVMNATDSHFQANNSGNIISQFIAPLFSNFSVSTLHIIERTAWWIHISGILIFLNYLYFSKHLHILLAFPNTYFADLNPNGELDNLESVTNEVKLMMDPTADPYAAPANPDAVLAKFGASDVQDLNWVQLLN
ncbi:MAG: hypothetical protein ACI924_001767, partial [Flavobacterium sp.]